MKNVIISIPAAEGLHARPAHLFCTAAGKYQADVRVRNASTGTKFVNAKSILMVLTLGVSQGHEVEIQASGFDEENAIESLKQLIEGNFKE
jgi:phosphotransferase system HPr (HPr) family protein